MVDGGGRPPETEFELAKSSGRPGPEESDAVRIAECLSFARVGATVGLSSLACLQPGESREGARKFGALPALVSEPNGFVVLDCRAGPVVTRRVVASHPHEQPREDPERSLCPCSLNGCLDEPVSATGLTDPKRCHDQPGEQPRVLTQVLVAFSEGNSGSERV